MEGARETTFRRSANRTPTRLPGSPAPQDTWFGHFAPRLVSPAPVSQSSSPLDALTEPGLPPARRKPVEAQRRLSEWALTLDLRHALGERANPAAERVASRIGETAGTGRVFETAVTPGRLVSALGELLV
jgi:hypothetical protein